MKSLDRIFNRKVRRIVIPIAAFLAAWHYRLPLWYVLSIIGNVHALVTYLKGLNALGPVMLFVLLLVQLFVPFIPGHALVMASGYIYGAPITIAVVSASTVFGSQLAFWLARKFGRPLIGRFASAEAIERWNRFAGDRGPLLYFFAFVLPFFPSDLMCYVAGLGKVSGKGFFVANVSGRLLCTTAITLIGAYGFRPPVFFWVLFAGSLLLLALGWGFYNKPFNITNSRVRFARACGRAISNVYRGLFGISYDIHFMEDLPAGPKILAANHPGASDSLLLPPIFDEPVTGLAEAGQFKNLITGWILTHSGHIPVQADSPLESFERARQALRAGHTLLIFPEGTVNPEYDELRAKSGAVRLWLVTGAPIIPIGIYVPRKDTINLRWYSSGRGHGGRFQIRGRYSVRVGRAWYPAASQPDGRSLQPARALAQHLMQEIYGLVQEAGRKDQHRELPESEYLRSQANDRP